MQRPKKNTASTNKKLLTGRYVNSCQIGFNSAEFVIDFGQSYEHSDSGLYHTRIVTSPLYAKRFFSTLHQSIADYESRHGAIEESTDG
jgi:hypothetical protein